MSSKIKKAKHVNSSNEVQAEAEKGKELVDRLISSKQKSDIITKESILADVN